MQVIQPKHWPKPKGYANGIIATGRVLYLGGQVGWDETETIVSDDFVKQVKQALLNIVAILNEAGGAPEHIVRMTWYVTDKDAYMNSQRELGRVYQEIMGKHYPAMSLLVISALVEEGAKVEIEATAVLP